MAAVPIPSEKAPKPGLNIYGCAAVNPIKLTIAAEELGIPYNYITLDMGAGEPKSEWYTANINPNGRMPALVHVKDEQDPSQTRTIFETAACLLYLISEFDPRHEKLSYPPETQEHWSTLSWLSWQVSGYGPQMGEANHYNRYATEPVPYAQWRHTAECKRLHAVLDHQLARTAYVVGERLTVADVAIFIFAHSAAWCGVEVSWSSYPNVERWRRRLVERPAFQKGLSVPVVYRMGDVSVRDEGDEEGQKVYRMIRKMGGKMIAGATEGWMGRGDVEKNGDDDDGKGVLRLPSDGANFES